MLVKVNVSLVNIDGKAMKDDDGQGQVIDATVRLAIVNAVLSPVKTDKGIDKVKKYELAKRVYTSDEVDLNEDEIKLIKDRVGESFAPVVVGQIYELLKV